MINEGVGETIFRDGERLRRTDAADDNFVVYGPYVMLTHGVYQADFRLGLAAPVDGAPRLCATIEVTADFGNTLIAQQRIYSPDLGSDVRTFPLLFVTRHVHTLEFRVWVHGGAEMLVGEEPAWHRVSGILDEEPVGGLEQHSVDADRLNLDTRRILRQLKPETLVGHGKVRLGSAADGGYVCIDDFAGIDTAFSFGINDDISWDLDAAERGVTIYQFDHTVTDPAPNDPRMIFEAKRIDREAGADSESLSRLIRTHDKRRERPNLILKMDIESGEWPVIDATPQDELARLAWIVCEMHYFQGLADAGHRDLIDRCLAKLAQDFAVVHVHSNVWGGYTSLANVVFPNVIEVTYANRRLYQVDDRAELFPTELDRSCDPRLPDFYLGSFRY